MLFYEQRKKKQKKRRSARRRPPFGAWLLRLCLKLLALALILCVIAAAALYAVPVSFFAVEPEGVDLALTDGLPASRDNVLLLGLDMAREGSRRSDTMIIASVGYRRLKLTSVLRDTVVDIPGRGVDKLNAAYAYGGPELVMRTLNARLGLNIMHYVAVDFTALADVVDAVGGVTLDVTEAEMERINRNIAAARRQIEAQGYSAEPLARFGEGTRLNGVQALYYARIRKLDSDFRRTGRQRTLLKALLDRVRSNLANPFMLVRLLQALARDVHTNMPLFQLISLGEKALSDGSPGQMQLPVDGTYADDGSRLTVSDWDRNIREFLAFAYD